MSALGAMLTVDLASPEQVAARHNRITARHAAANARAHRINQALTVLRYDCTTEDDAVRALHAISAGLITTVPEIKSDIYQSVQWIDEVADQIQFRNKS